jgi:hypothetical protein
MPDTKEKVRNRSSAEDAKLTSLDLKENWLSTRGATIR